MIALSATGNHLKKGKHISLDDYSLIIEQAKDSNVLQVASGGGNPNMHPDFGRILKMTLDAGIVPSYTSNGDGLSMDILKNTAKYCGAMAISAYPPFNELFEHKIQKITEYGIKLNIHFLLDKKTIKTAIQWLENPPSFLRGINAIIFLNYKPINSRLDLLLNRSQDLSLFFELVNSGNNNAKIGFDSCSVSGIAKHMNVNPIFYESCEAARFSAFISEDTRMYPCSFVVETNNYVSLRKTSLKDTWTLSAAFINHRNSINQTSCQNCEVKNLCNGGCVYMPEINLCRV